MSADMQMNPNDPPGYETNEAWLGSDEDVEDLWKTTSDEIFAITNDSVYLPDGIGPLDGEQQVTFDELDSYDVDVEYLNNPRSVAIPFAFAGVCILSGVLVGGALGVILAVAGVIALLVGGIMVVKERNDVTALTRISFQMGRFSETIELEGDEEEYVHDILSPHFD